MNQYEKRIAAICCTNDKTEIQQIFAMIDCDWHDCSPQEFDEAVEKAFSQWKPNAAAYAAKHAHSLVNKGRICCVLCDAQVRGATFYDFKFNKERTQLSWDMCPNHTIRCAMRMLSNSDVLLLRNLAGGETFITHDDFYDENGESLQPIGNARKVPKTTNYALIARFFNENDNQWVTMRKLVEATKILRSSVRDVVYRTCKTRFERRDLPERGGPTMQFRLRV